MAKKKIGYVELLWTCPKCGTVNPGPVKLCNGCGAAQPVDVKFEQAPRQELITDEAAKAKAKAGADIHCPYCGTRNSADAKVCVQCGGDLVQGIKREQGKVMGAFTTGPVEKIKCPRCGTENPDTALVCSQCGGSLKASEPEAEPSQPTPKVPRKIPVWVYAAIGVGVLLICGVIGYIVFLSQKTEAIVGTVEQVRWERSIPIEALVPVEYQTWQDQVPQGGQSQNITRWFCRLMVQFGWLMRLTLLTGQGYEAQLEYQAHDLMYAYRDE
jgi:ribosomal protein L40E